jgi:hypothetical protein
MDFSWLSLIGGGIVAAATLSVGISMSGFLAPSTTSPAAQASAAASPQTIYVEQPVIEVPAIAPATPVVSQPPLIIAILPADTATDASSSGPTLSSGGTGPTPSTPPPTTTPTNTPTPAPTLTPIFTGGGGDDGDDGGDDRGGEDGEHGERDD